MVQTTPHDPYAAFRVPNLLRYLSGSMLLQIGIGAQSLAIGYYIFQRTGQPLALGLVGGVQAIPMLLLSLPAGWLADRFDRRRVVTFCLSAVALCSLGLGYVVARHGSIPLMYLLLLLDATMMTLQRPAASAIFPGLVPVEVFENAMKWRTSIDQVCAVAGPALGGIIIVWSIPAAFIVAALSALVFIGLLLTIHLTPHAESAARVTLASVGDGVRFVWSRKVLLAAISLDLFAVLLGGAVYLLPVYAQDILHVGPTGLAALRAAPAVGAFCMAIILAHLPPLRRAGLTMLIATAGFGVATMAFGLSHIFWLSCALLFLTGATDNISVVVRHTLMMTLTPDHMRGRVSAVNYLFIGSSNEIGGLESGALAQAAGPVFSVVGGGIGTLVVVGIWALAFPHLRRFGALSCMANEVKMVEKDELQTSRV
jgi:MFS family permease